MANRFARSSSASRGRAPVCALVIASVLAACADTNDAPYAPPALPGHDASDAGADVAAPDASLDAANPDDASAGEDADAAPDTSPCTTTFTFAPSGRAVTSVAVTGEWNAFAAPGVVMKADASGVYSASVPLPSGLVAYKLLIDGNYEFDAASGLRKYVGGIENSAVRVADCHVPTLSLSTKSVTRSAAGNGHFTGKVTYRDGKGGAGADPKSLAVTLRKDGVATPVQTAQNAWAANNEIALDVNALADGKYTLFVDAADRAGHKAKTLRLVFWIEAEAFDWHDALIYMAMTDRFVNGDPTNDAPPTSGVDPRADYRGGDLQGIRAKIKDGTFDKLGVRALWLSPFHVNPKGAYGADDGVHSVTGYHGYWPIKARGVEPRIGGDDALKAVVAEAHAHGIRILQDFVVNHVHKEHEYFAQHPDWFRTGCVCGTNNCDWTTHRLDCLFSDFLPDVNWTVPDVSEQYGDDAVWWVDSFDLDGLRIDAVKHVEDLAIMNLSARLRGEFENAGTKLFLTGETAMGWSDCGLACNADQYGTISRYIGPFGLDGQFDFVLYYAVPSQVFMNDAKGMIHADYWSQASGWEYPQGAIMTPYIGTQDTPRFTTLATYRGQDAAHDPSIPSNKWANVASAPTDAEPYARTRLAMAWLLAQPGAPMMYYGDEYGEWGGADPNNRGLWRGEPSLSADETTTLAWTRALGTARRTLPALRRGAYVPVQSTEDTLVFARKTAAGETAIVAMTRAATAQSVTVPLPATLAMADGTTLKDRLGGASVTVTSGAISIALGARGAAILAP